MSHPDHETGQKPLLPGDDAGPVYYAEPPEKKGRGCFFWGCITTLIVGALGLLLVIAAVVVAGFWLNAQIKEWTAESPEPVPVVNMPEDQKKELFERWDAFRKALDDGKDAEIVLNADELNTLIDRESALKGKVYATIKDDQVGAKVSFPLGELGIPGLGGRYLNGTVSVTAKINEGGDLDVRLKDVEVKGKKMTPEMREQFAKQNLAEQFANNPDNRAFIRKIRKIEVKDSKIHIQARDVTKAADATKPKDAEKVEATPAPKDAPKPDAAAPKSDEAPKKEEAPAPKPADAKPADAPAPKKAAA